MSDDQQIIIALGGGCHWCTEAVFDSLLGVSHVDQGWAASTGDDQCHSEAVKLQVDLSKVTLEIILEIHLLTHSSTSNHSMRGKYRSAVYVKSPEDGARVQACLSGLQAVFDKPLVTRVLSLETFKSNHQYQNYYYQNPDKQFCQRYIAPKLKLLLERFSKHAKLDKVNCAVIT